jgi:hypothetical protein
VLAEMCHLTEYTQTNFSAKNNSKRNLLHPGAGTIKPEIISSLIIGGSEGGGGHTNDSMMSSVDLKIPAKSGGSTRDDLDFHQKKKPPRRRIEMEENRFEFLFQFQLKS